MTDLNRKTNFDLSEIELLAKLTKQKLTRVVSLQKLKYIFESKNLSAEENTKLISCKVVLLQKEVNNFKIK